MKPSRFELCMGQLLKAQEKLEKARAHADAVREYRAKIKQRDGIQSLPRGRPKNSQI